MEYMSDIGHSANAYRPSLFEVVAEEKMKGMLRPALKYVLTVYAQNYPRYLLRAVNWFDELYAIAMCAVEGHYLLQTGGSFAENFYGLKRARTGRPRRRRGFPADLAKNSKDAGLSPAEVRLSLILLVGVPYVKAKLDDFYETVSGRTRMLILGDDFDEDAGDEPYAPAYASQPLSRAEKFKRIAKRAFRRGYPWVNATWHMSILGYYIAYLCEKTRYFSPGLHLLGLEIRRMSMEDYRSAAQRERMSSREFPSWSSELSLPAFAKMLVVTLLSRGLDSLKVVLPTSIFFFRFLEWWYASKFNTVAEQQPIPPPPESLKPHPDGTPLPDDRTICPLCQRKRTNATATSSGYVFCYPCIYRHVHAYGECPVTKFRCDTEGLRKI